MGRRNKSPEYVRIKKFSISEFEKKYLELSELKKEKFKEQSYRKNSSEYRKLTEWIVDGLYPVKMNSSRYKLFIEKGTTCVCCGLVGEFLALERHRKQRSSCYYHFNLYGVKDNKEIIFTKDHIVPKSKGGKNVISNYQTMCVDCNQRKANKINFVKRCCGKK